LGIHCRRIQAPRFELAAHFVHPIPLPDLTSTHGELSDFGQRIHSGQAYDDNALDSIVLAAYGVKQSSLRTVARKAHDLASRTDDDEKEFRKLVRLQALIFG
jgi:hypothetical protein